MLLQLIVVEIWRTNRIRRGSPHSQQRATLWAIYSRAQAYISTYVRTTPANGISHILA